MSILNYCDEDSRRMERIEKALMACEKVIDGIEEETISTSSALLQCSKIARLTNDEEAILWFQYEYGGYPRTKDGHIQKNAWNIAYQRGRGYVDNGDALIFTELASELEEKIRAQQDSINNFTTQGTSVGGDYAYAAMNKLTSSVENSTNLLVRSITNSQKRLALLKSKYYEYAVKKQIELSFGNIAEDVFRKKVDNAFSDLSKETLLKLQAMEGKLDTINPELYSQALTTCRRLFESTADELFEKYYPDYSDKVYRTKSGKEIDVSGDHFKNKLSAIIEYLENKSEKKTLVGSNIIYLLDWIDNINELQCKGVHHEISRSDAERCIIQTYICLGDILNMQSE